MIMIPKNDGLIEDNPNEIIKSLFGNIEIKTSKDEGITKDQKEMCSSVEEIISNMVNTLRKVCKNKHINEVANIMWEMLRRQIVLTAIHPNVPTVSFVVASKEEPPVPGGEGVMAVILIPFGFEKMVKEDPYFRLGGMVYVASQIRDFWSERIGNKRETLRRARAYEAEFLLVAQKEKMFTGLNQYQKMVLDENPQGLSSLPPEMMYSSKPI